jgi:hypothetical protein
LHEGNEDQGKYGKQGWSIARRCIAIAMDQGGSIKIAYRDVGGRATQGAVAESSQIFLEFVQAQTEFLIMLTFSGILLNYKNIHQKWVPPSCNMRASPHPGCLIAGKYPAAETASSSMALQTGRGQS